MENALKEQASKAVTVCATTTCSFKSSCKNSYMYSNKDLIKDRQVQHVDELKCIEEDMYMYDMYVVAQFDSCANCTDKVCRS